MLVHKPDRMEEMSKQSYIHTSISLAAAMRRIQTIELSIRFKLGETIIEGLRSPGDLPRFVGELLALRRLRNKKKAWFALGRQLDIGLPADRFRDWDTFVCISEAELKHGLALVDRYMEGKLPEIDALSLDEFVCRVHQRLKDFDKISDMDVVPIVRTKIENDAPSSLYVLNSLAPFVLNGYTRRSEAVMETLEDAGISVFPIALLRGHTDLDPELLSISGRMAKLVPVHCLHDEFELATDAFAEHIVEFAKQTEVACIHAASNWFIGLSALKAARELSLPFIYELRGFWEFTRSSVDPAYGKGAAFRAQNDLETYVARQADHAFALNSEIKAVLVERGMVDENIELLPNGVQIPTSSFDETSSSFCAIKKKLPFSNAFTVSFIGSVTPYEDFDTILKTIKILCSQGRNIQLCVAGDGPDLPRIRQKVARLGLQERVLFTGQVSPDLARKLYQLTDVAVYIRDASLVSKTVQPLKPLEAMSEGVPVVLTDFGLFRDLVVPGETGYLVQAQSVSSLARCLSSIMDDPNKARSIGKAGQTWVLANRTWEKCLAPLLRKYGAT